MCIIKNCKIIPYYNFEGETKAIYCTSHKSNGMINIISKTCEFEGCKTIPVYNFEGETKAIYCASHKSDGMINIKNKVQGIQFLVKEKIIKIPPTTQGQSSGNEIPSWIKNNAGWWAEGTIDDDSFVQGIQFLIKEGILRI